MVKTVKVVKGPSKAARKGGKRKRPVARTPKPASVKASPYKIAADLAKLLGENNQMFTEYTAILVRRDKTLRVLVKQVSEGEARKAINQNWQHRNHPENAHTYVLVGEDGTVKGITPNQYVPAAAPIPTPKRQAIA